MVNYIHGLSQAHNHGPCPSTCKPHVQSPKPAESPHGWHHTPRPHLCRSGCCWEQPRLAAAMPLFYSQLSPPGPRGEAGVPLQSDLAGPGKGSLPLPRPPEPSPSPWPRTGRSSSRKRVKSQHFSSTAQHSEEAPETDIALLAQLKVASYRVLLSLPKPDGYGLVGKESRQLFFQHHPAGVHCKAQAKTYIQ